MIRKITHVRNDEWAEHTCHISPGQAVNTPVEKDLDEGDYHQKMHFKQRLNP